MDAGTGEIAAHLLTEDHAGDAKQVLALLGHTEGQIASLTADGAYDGEPTYAAATARQHDSPPDVVILPRARSLPAQQGEVAIAVATLKTMIRTAKSLSVRVI